MEALAAGQQRLALVADKGFKRKDRPRRGPSTSSVASSSQGAGAAVAPPTAPAKPDPLPATPIESPDKVTPEPKHQRLSNSPEPDLDEKMPESMPRNLEPEFAANPL